MQFPYQTNLIQNHRLHVYFLSVVTCPLPIPPKNGYFVKEKCSNVLNAACGVRCNIGFELMGSSVRICQKNGTWTGNQPICKAKHCPSLKAVAHAEVVCSHEDEGYQKMTSYGERGQVLKEIVKRKPVHKNVILENETTNEFTVDTECRFGCPVGFTMIGSKLRTCLPLTRWDGLQTTCKRKASVVYKRNIFNFCCRITLKKILCFQPLFVHPSRKSLMAYMNLITALRQV